MSEKYLDDVELECILNADLQEQLSAEKKNCADRDLKLVEARIRALELEFKIARFEQTTCRDRVVFLDNSTNGRKEERKQLLKSIAKKYSIEGSWGYDPKSGLIHEDNNGN